MPSGRQSRESQPAAQLAAAAACVHAAAYVLTGPTHRPLTDFAAQANVVPSEKMAAATRWAIWCALSEVELVMPPRGMALV